ncbi:MAG: YihY/virulence factor BrkB family protein [Mariniphaga sp.]|nr:YihY/virulence factor BrkB family protein [Mariniphaga sp.]
MSMGIFHSRRLKRIGLRIVIRAKRITLPFFDGVPLYDVSLFFWKSITKGAITTRASGIAFSFFLALFPTIIFVFTLIPYMPIPNFQDDLYLIIKDIVPDSVYFWIKDTIDGILNERRGDLLSLGFFMALLFSTNGFTAMMVAFDSTVHNYKKHSWLGQRLVSILLLLILSILLTLTIAMLAGGQWLIKDVLDLQNQFTFYLLTVGRWIIIIALFFFAYSFLYYMAPAKKTQWRFISAGGSLATVLSIVTFVGFGYYINNFSQYNKLYGSIGTLLIVMLLIYFLSLILLIGFELNASIKQAHGNKVDL